MEASHFLRDEHKQIIGLLRQGKGAIRRVHDMVPGVCREISMELEIYFQLKKEFVYPLIPNETLAVASQGEEGIRRTLDEIKALINQGEKVHSTIISRLTIQVEEYFNSEKNEVFPFLDGVEGEPMRKRKFELLKLPTYARSRPEVVQNPLGGEQRRKKDAA